MHVIPGVDDGSFSMEMSRSMLMTAYLQGIKTVFATPHSQAFATDPESVLEKYIVLKEEIEELPLGMRLFLGCEVRCELANMSQVLKALETGKYPSMNNTKYVLTEFSSLTGGAEALEIAGQLLASGWIPIIAHVERYNGLYAKTENGQGESSEYRIDFVEELLDMECLLQINADSLEDESDRASGERARQLIRERKVSFLGSDAHRMNHRPPSVEQGLKYLYSHCEKAYAEAVTEDNAKRLLCCDIGI